MIKHIFEQQSKAWDEIRCGRITGTRFKILMSGEKTKGYLDLIKDIAGEIITGTKEETYSNAIMERGIELESEAAKEYEFLFDTKLNEIGFITPDIDNKYQDWIGISPDRLSEKGLVEIKCPLRKTHLSYIRANKLPNEYKYQVQSQLFVTGLPYCDFMSYYPKMKSFIIRIYPDIEIFNKFEYALDVIIPKIKEEISMYNSYDFMT